MTAGKIHILYFSISSQVEIFSISFPHDISFSRNSEVNCAVLFATISSMIAPSEFTISIVSTKHLSMHNNDCDGVDFRKSGYRISFSSVFVLLAHSFSMFMTSSCNGAHLISNDRFIS
jgi:hypothetical protein